MHWFRESWLVGLVLTDRTLQIILTGVVILLALAAFNGEPSCWVPVSDLDHETRSLMDGDGGEVEVLYVRIAPSECS